MAKLRFEISFKNTTKDKELYKHIMSKEKQVRSEFVKQALEFYINYLEEDINV